MLKTPIVVGIDFSAGSDAATKQAVRLARAWKATLLCVHIIDEQGVANLAATAATFSSEAAREG